MELSAFGVHCYCFMAGILGCVRNVFLSQHPSTLACNMYWGGCQKRRAAECRSVQSRTLSLALQTTRSYSSRQPKFQRRHSSGWARRQNRLDFEFPRSRHPGCDHKVNSCERWKCRSHTDVYLTWQRDSLLYQLQI